MRDIQFVKMQGAGNDFVIIDMISKVGAQNIAPLPQDNIDYPSLSRVICDRHFGIGADGLILVLPSDKANYKMRVINPDGSEAEMCGNGIRCFARYIWERSANGSSEGRVSNPPVQNAGTDSVISVETLAGVIVPAVITENGEFSAVEVDMGSPKVGALMEQLNIEGVSYKINKISMGNPHCVIFVDDLDKVELSSIGPVIENLPQFPERTNVEFAQIINKQEIGLKVWERGVGETLACGTGACAVLVAAVSNNLCERKAVVHLPGGDLMIEWSDDGHVIMRGPAENVFSGSFPFTEK